MSVHKPSRRPDRTALHGADTTASRKADINASLKGLLKPFKGKGDYAFFREQLLSVRHTLERAMAEAELAFGRSPCSVLEARLVRLKQNSALFLRWRNKRGDMMGMKCFENMLATPNLPEHLKQQVFEFEQERLMLNFQMSCVQSLLTHTTRCMDSAEQSQALL